MSGKRKYWLLGVGMLAVILSLTSFSLWLKEGANNNNSKIKSQYIINNPPCQNNIRKNKDSCFISFITPTLFRYVGYRFTFEGTDTTNLKIESRNLSLRKNADGSFFMSINDDSTYGGASISFYRKTIEKKNLLYSTYLSPCEPPVDLEIAGQRSGAKVPVGKFENGGILARLINFDIDLKFPIKSFALILTQNDSVIKIDTKGPSISKKQYFYIKQVKNNQPIVFDNIIIERPNGQLVQMEPLVYYVTQ